MNENNVLLRQELNKLSSAQRHCVLHNEGAAIVLAGPGSGKTRVITVRVMRLVLSGYRVLTMSFNKAAALEMEARAGALLGEALESYACFSTIHGYCYKIIREYIKQRNLSQPIVLSEERRREIICRIYLEVTEEKQISEDETSLLSSYISMKTSGDIDSSSKMIMLAGQEAEQVYIKYSQLKKRCNYIDFDDMIARAYEILLNDGEFCNRVAGGFDYLQVDEAQDLSLGQYNVIKLLGRSNIFAVADDDQSIYGFRGAQPSLLFEFERNTSGCRRYLLEENYRSQLNITAVSSEFIKNNAVRFEKNIFTKNNPLEYISLKSLKNSEVQAVFTAREVIKAAEKGGSVCVLYRNNISSLCILAAVCGECYVKKKNVPKVIIRGEKINLSDFSCIENVFFEIGRREEESSFIDFKSPITYFNDFQEEKMIDYMLFSKALSGKRRFFINCVEETARIICRYANCHRATLAIYENLCEVIKFSEDTSKICFSTIHSAKGLEFDDVFIVDTVEGELPGGMGDDSLKTVEEERRLMYVAMTRAKSKLTILYPKKCGRLLMHKSRFVDETRKAMNA